LGELRVAVHTTEGFLVTETMILCFCVFEAWIDSFFSKSLAASEFNLLPFSFFLPEFP